MLPDYLITDTSITEYLGEFLKDHTYSKIGILTDENTRELCYPLISEILPNHELYEFPEGEKYKTLDTCRKIWDWMTIQGFDRHSLLVNLGGGVIGDMGGFCAATFKRGLEFINIPTTLLSQVDASIGGKLGIDYGNFKNHIGLFRNPLRVVIDPLFLQTLPEREILSGYAEVIKHSLIADTAHWEQLCHTPIASLEWKSIILHSIQIKSDIVMQDPFETGLRKILNFGHTLGHAVESHFLNSSPHLLHGEAVAAGMIMESYLSVKLAGLAKEKLNQITSYIVDSYGHHEIGEENYSGIYEKTLQDKKNKGDEIWAVLLRNIGDPEDFKLRKPEILEAIQFYDSI